MIGDAWPLLLALVIFLAPFAAAAAFILSEAQEDADRQREAMRARREALE